MFEAKTISIKENIPESAVVISGLDAVDPDNDSVVYTIVSGNLDNTFKIEPTTGQISLNQSPDYEHIDSYTLVVRVSDTHGLSTVQPVSILIQNVNEKPIVKDLSFFYNQETCIVGELVAHDPENQPVSFRIKNPDKSSGFYIDGNILKALDHFIFHQDAYVLIVEASDHKDLTASANIRIILVDFWPEAQY